MNKTASFLLNTLLLGLFAGMLVLPAVSMGVAEVAPARTSVLSEQDVKEEQPEQIVKKVTRPSKQTTQSTTSQFAR